MAALSGHQVPVYLLAVRKIPKSGTSDQLLEFEEISKNAIVRQVQKIIQS